MRLIDADLLIKGFKNPTKEEIRKVLREEYDNAPNDEAAAEAILNMYETVISAIKSAPTIDSPRPDWTPCAEGMPTKLGYYQTTTEITLHNSKGDKYRGYAVRKFGKQGRFCGESDDRKVIAWMPKPDPYNPDHKED